MTSKKTASIDVERFWNPRKTRTSMNTSMTSFTVIYNLSQSFVSEVSRKPKLAQRNQATEKEAKRKLSKLSKTKNRQENHFHQSKTSFPLRDIQKRRHLPRARTSSRVPSWVTGVVVESPGGLASNIDHGT